MAARTAALVGRAVAVLSLIASPCAEGAAAGPARPPDAAERAPDASAPQVLPRSVDEAVREIASTWLSPADRDAILQMPEANLVGLHLGLGMAIRNRFGLWGKNPELLASCGKSHPDDCSGVILKALWRSIRADADPKRVEALDRHFELMEEIKIDYRGFSRLETGEWLRAVQTQVEAALRERRRTTGKEAALRIRVEGDPDPHCYTRAEFSEDGSGPVSLRAFLGWFDWRNAFTERHEPPDLVFVFGKRCAWPKPWE